MSPADSPRRAWPACGRAAGLLLLAFAVFVVVSGTGRPTVAEHGPGDPAAAVAVVTLTGPDPAAAVVPDGFASATGYRPVREARRLVDPRGACSSPVSLPAALTSACRAHDLGYDLLRYADRNGHPLGAWARRTIDARFARDAEAGCDAARGCRVMAWVAARVVEANTWRQGGSVPVVESPLPSTVGAAAALLVVVAGRRRCQRSSSIRVLPRVFGLT